MATIPLPDTGLGQLELSTLVILLHSEVLASLGETWPSPTLSSAAKRPLVQNSLANAFADLHRCVVRRSRLRATRGLSHRSWGPGRSGGSRNGGRCTRNVSDVPRPSSGCPSPPVHRSAAIVAHRRHRRPSSPTVATVGPSSPIVASRRPPSPIVAHRRPPSPTVAHRRPPSPSVAHRRPPRSRVAAPIVQRRSAVARQGRGVAAVRPASGTSAQGPACLPIDVLERAQDELLNWGGSGVSVMEMSHRGKEFQSIIARTEGNLRTLLNVPDNYQSPVRAGRRVHAVQQRAPELDHVPGGRGRLTL